MEGPWKFRGGGGSQSQNFKRKVWGLTGNSRGAGGIQTKKPSVGGVWIFSGATHYESLYSVLIFEMCGDVNG